MRTSSTSMNSSSAKKIWSCLDSSNQMRAHGSSWKENDCNHCSCINGENRCFSYQHKCPRLKCARPILKKGQCCPYCLDTINSPYILSNDFNLTSLPPCEFLFLVFFSLKKMQAILSFSFFKSL